MKNRNKVLTGLRFFMVILLIGVLIFTQVRKTESNTPIADVAAQTTSELDMSSLKESSNRMFKKFYGLDASDYDAVVLYSAISSMDVDEILIVKLKDSDQEEDLTSAINDRKETLENSFKNYGVDQYALLTSSILDVQQNYLLYVVHPEAPIADQDFRDSL